jgi:hypothetical protein
MAATSPYHPEYDGYYAMLWHDKEENALKRWFDNFKVERYASFAADTEWLVVKEVPSDRRRKKRYVCEIGDDGRGTTRDVIMDHTAPPAPILTFAAKRRYVPPPPKSAADLRKEEEWRRMTMMGYEPIRRARMPKMPVFIGWDMAAVPDMSVEIEYDIEWVRRRPPSYFEPPREYRAPPPPRHRRNA